MYQNSTSCELKGRSRSLPGLETADVDEVVARAVLDVAKLAVENAAACPHKIFRGARIVSKTDLKRVFGIWLIAYLKQYFRQVRSLKFVSSSRLTIKVGDSGRCALLDLPSDLIVFLETPPEWIRKKIGKNTSN